MRFTIFIQALDLGQCKDQIQRQALFDIALMFVMIDGVIDEQERSYMQGWLAQLEWSSETDKLDYYNTVESKVIDAIAENEIENFLAHRAILLSDPWMKEQALQLAVDISRADGQLDESEKAAIEFLMVKLADKR
ncbi:MULTISPECIES: TerB family tellurite resistance protein [Alteromonadaceae]|uniref:TerB family tellurite resistance protein n=1 Tax=Alteromonadaceae TaxID=72275 RepID=UPI001C084467|nr:MULTISPECIES: TerB family tellurite resistance protein [Aliiglaciecola]MBU2878305.1 TerB family tellurite resistance protein [Aliiglaciecola lipolytica]MDO6711783.1 TerB family tellurite resistance protein [Aliiglaciecola sp. 2_MG-2023]MDO6753043.1 TerB family tellurite resistance protein [Aliiglaciecola sp. 1_MG-2023]